MFTLITIFLFMCNLNIKLNMAASYLDTGNKSMSINSISVSA